MTVRPFDLDVLEVVAGAPDVGASVGYLRERVASPELACALDRLEDRGAVQRYAGAVYSISRFGRGLLGARRATASA